MFNIDKKASEMKNANYMTWQNTQMQHEMFQIFHVTKDFFWIIIYAI